MSEYTNAELEEIRAVMREEAICELQAAERSQNGLAIFLKTMGMHVLARIVTNMSISIWHRFRRMIGWA